MERLHVIVSGYVQGVGFRHWAVREARFLGLTGWVRNLADGTVEVTAEGDRASLTAFLGELRRGPSYADVESVSPAFLTAIGEFRDFHAI